MVAGLEAGLRVRSGQVSGRWRRECRPLRCPGDLGGSRSLELFRILEVSRVAARLEGRARPACASPESDLGLSCSGY